MFAKSTVLRAFILALTLALPLVGIAAQPSNASPEDGIIKVRSAYGFGETIARLEADIAAKGITFFSAIDQSQLGVGAGIKLKPSTLLIFGNPPL